ncbi:MAG: hypothetical protein AMJ46_13820 [Latescibacteria bacterium DG_63]|nr:MAG: hypothetical protein AMJ46_13820 [Latescibacteria bacterium DG_63]
MRTYKRGRYWYVDFTHKGRRIRRRIGRSKRLAELALKDIEVKVVKGEFLGAYEDRRLVFEEVAEEYLEFSELRKAKSSYERDITSLRPNLIPHFGDEYIGNISTKHIEQYVAKRRQRVSPATINRELSCLKHLYTKAIEWGYVRENPAKAVKKLKEPPGRVRYLQQEEIDALLAHCSPHVRRIVVAAIHTGMRRSELLSLKWQDVNLRQRTVTVRNSKNNEQRTIPINSTLLQELKKTPRHIRSDFLFCDSEGRPYGDIKKGFRGAVKRAGIEDFRFHDLRHTFASHLMMGGADLRTVQELLGHKGLSMTMRYSHLSHKHLEGAVESLARQLLGTLDEPRVRDKSDDR